MFSSVPRVMTNEWGRTGQGGRQPPRPLSRSSSWADGDLASPSAIAEAQPAAGQHLGVQDLERGAHRLPVIDDQPEVAGLVGRLRPGRRERDELVARVEEGHVVAHPPSQLELDEAAVEGQRGVQVVDLQRDVVDADQAGHGACSRLPLSGSGQVGWVARETG